jgi:hypothetical protein
VDMEDLDTNLSALQYKLDSIRKRLYDPYTSRQTVSQNSFKLFFNTNKSLVSNIHFTDF